jgi:two-component system response regulator AtoC
MSNLGRILIADDEETFLESTADLLREEGYECDCAPDAQIATEMLNQKSYDLLIADIKMPGNHGLELIKEMPKIAETLTAILVTGYPSLNTAIMATRLSVAGYLLKPVVFEELLKLVHESVVRARAFRGFYGAWKPLQDPSQERETFIRYASAGFFNDAKDFSHKEILHVPDGTGATTAALANWNNTNPEDQEGAGPGTNTRDYQFENIVAKSMTMRQVVDIVKKAAATDSNVLIFGETGTGKELIARAIHRLSSRKDDEFVPVDCVAIPFNLLESELFGFEKGAFTGAANRKRGLLEFAQKGTLFLDEISELKVNLQAKLLRVLQERQFRRLGGKELIDLDIRVIAAMNRNPAKVLAKGQLRRDLFYRLNVIPVHVPALRCRREDIPLLALFFLERAIKVYHVASPKKLSPAALDLLQNYRWPGNVRQLKNVIERLVSLSPGPMINVEDLPSFVKNGDARKNGSVFDLPYNKAKRRMTEAFDRRYLRKLLRACGHNIPQAAQMAGISGRTIYRMIHRYGKS